RSDGTSQTFLNKAAHCQSKIIFASDEWKVTILQKDNNNLSTEVERLLINDPVKTKAFKLTLDLPGSYQTKNLKGVLAAIFELQEQGYLITDNDITYALGHVKELTGLRARWQTLSTDPLIICDTGHNEDGWKEVLSNINATAFKKLHMVIGIMRDKNSEKLLSLLPKDATYYFCNANFER